MRIAEIIPFPNAISDAAIGASESQAAVAPSGAAEIEQMLQARARIRKVLDELDRLNGELSQMIVEG